MNGFHLKTLHTYDLGVLIAYFPFIRHGPHRKRRLQQFFVSVGMCLPSRCLATIGHTHTDPQSLVWYNTDNTQNEASNSFPIVGCIRCSGNVFTEPLLSNDRRYTDSQSHLWYDTNSTQKDASISFSIVGTIRDRGNVVTEPLPSNITRNTFRRAVVQR
jgi:hypothetical protein